MRHILNERYRLRGWYKLPRGLFDNVCKTAAFLKGEDYLILLKCDGAHDFDPPTQEEEETLKALQDEGQIARLQDWQSRHLVSPSTWVGTRLRRWP